MAFSAGGNGGRKSPEGLALIIGLATGNQRERLKPIQSFKFPHRGDLICGQAGCLQTGQRWHGVDSMAELRTPPL
jgi:hypothetical protein